MVYIYVYIHTCIYTYNGILLSHKKKNGIMSFAAAWMDLEIIILSKSEIDKYMISFICGI